MRVWMAALMATALAMPVLAGFDARAADECPRGALDAKYCDRDGDMLADTPTDADDILDPKTLIFSYTPIEDPAMWQDVWARFLGHMEKVTGKRVTFFQVQNYSAQLEAMRSGRLHVAGVNAGSTPVAVNCAGFVPATQLGTPTGPWGYTMEIIVPANSPAKQVTDLKGKTIAFVSPTSATGFKAPTVFLKTKFNMLLDKDYQSRFTGKHETSIIGVANDDYEAAAVAGDLITRMNERSVIDAKKLRIIYVSDPFPGTAFGYTNRLKPELAAKVREAFLTYDFENDPKLKRELPDVTRFVSTDYKGAFQMIRDIDTESGVKYDCK
ncbi:MAG: phosphate/phosphite/phosphonate ABC transporter substrate-binding protein [Rhodospirillaceae bacterium]|nr:phosphate/phosphite/phosphonate ABC transporter substrate-binding protein [Rhodospirillaceae bacterium]